MKETALIKSVPDSQSGELALSKITLPEDYKEKWNEHMTDFLCLSRNGELVRPTLYRKGGINNLGKDRYFMLLKYIEGFYDVKITADPKRRPHLEGHWCILDKNGNEKVIFDSYEHGYLVKNAPIYSIKSKYYNIETGEFYCYASKVIDSSEYLFLENRYPQSTDPYREPGVYQIRKSDGEIQQIFKLEER